MSLQYTTSANIRAKLKRSILYRLSFVFCYYTSNPQIAIRHQSTKVWNAYYIRLHKSEGITLELIVNYCIIWYTLSGFYMLTMKKSVQYLIWLKSPEVNGLRLAVSAWRIVCGRPSLLFTCSYIIIIRGYEYCPLIHDSFFFSLLV